MTAKEIVIVVGFGYPHYKWVNGKPTFQAVSPRVFRNVAEKYLKRYRALHPDDLSELRVTIFDADRGKIESGQPGVNIVPPPVKRVSQAPNLRQYLAFDGATAQGRSAAPRSADQSFLYFPQSSHLEQSSFTLKEYLHRYHEKGDAPDPPEVSATDVYSYILEVAAARDRKIIELHFFSHSYHGGPILINTGEYFERDSGMPLNVRDPLDRDFRWMKDFPPPGTDPRTYRGRPFAAGWPKTFENAFADDAFCAVWGCHAWRFPKNLILNVLKSGAGSSPTALVPIKWTPSWGDSQNLIYLFDADHPATVAERASDKQLKRVEGRVLMSRVTDALRRWIEESFMYRLAKHSNRPVYGALPGTGTDFDRDGLMRVSTEPGDNYTGINAFYRDRLNMPFEGDFGKRGYSTFWP